MTYPVTLPQLLLFFLIFVRMSGMLLVAPVFNVRFVPVRFRIGLAFFLSGIAFPVIVTSAPMEVISQGDTGTFIILVIKEILTGISLGIIGMFIFSAFHVAGQLIDTQIGFSISSVFDPASGVQTTLFSNFKNLLAILLFLGMNGHHALIMGILQSFQYVPVGSIAISGNFIDVIIKVFTIMILLGIKMAAPVVVALFLTDVAFAVLSKSVPQLNVFIVGLPFKLAIGLLVVVLSMSALVVLFNEMFRLLFDRMEMLLHAMVNH